MPGNRAGAATDEAGATQQLYLRGRQSVGIHNKQQRLKNDQHLGQRLEDDNDNQCNILGHGGIEFSTPGSVKIVTADF